MSSQADSNGASHRLDACGQNVEVSACMLVLENRATIVTALDKFTVGRDRYFRISVVVGENPWHQLLDKLIYSGRSLVWIRFSQSRITVFRVD